MSKIRKNYENSPAGRFEAWYKGSYDPVRDNMEMHPIESGEDKLDELRNQVDFRYIKATTYSRDTNRTLQISRRIYTVITILMTVTMISVLIWMVRFLPPFGNAHNPVNNEVSARYIEKGVEETGAINYVSGMILDYRAFDTFGESCVLFIATICVQILLRLTPRDREKGEEVNDRIYEPKNDLIQQKVCVILVPFLFIFGIYIILNGHLSPGGGFSGGAVLGAALILYLCSFGYKKTERFFTVKTFRIISLVALITYCLAKSYSFYTGANHLESHIPLGTPGNILSSGLILVLNICVGSVVACTMYAFYTLFRKGDF